MNILLIGLGSAGQRHLRILKEIFDDANKIFVYRGQHKRGLISINLQNENMDINPIEFYGAQELLHTDEFQKQGWDLTIIATPPNSHLEYLNRTISISKRILIEKPISTDLDSAIRIREAAKITRKPVLIGYQLIFHELIQKLIQIIPKLGDIQSCNLVFIESLLAMNPFRSMDDHHLAKPDGGGVFLGLSHDLDLVISLFEATGYKKAAFSNILNSPTGAIIACELSATLISDKGALPIKSQFSISEKNTSRTLTINGSQARLKLDLVSQILVVDDYHGNNIFQENLVIDKDSLFRAQIEHLMDTKDLDTFCESNLDRSILISELNELLCKTL
jgi:predicted dehydrogenase